jgi:hypothetical protein
MTSTGAPGSVRADKVTLIAVWFGINAAISLFLVAVLAFVFSGLVSPLCHPQAAPDGLPVAGAAGPRATGLLLLIESPKTVAV